MRFFSIRGIVKLITKLWGIRMKLSKKHILFLISGVILAGAYLLLSQTQCICHTQTANFGFVPREELPYTSYLSIPFQETLILCALEVLLLPARNKLLRILAIPVAAVKVVYPFATLWALNFISSAVSGGAGQYSFSGIAPWLMAALGVLSLIQMILMAVRLTK